MTESKTAPPPEQAKLIPLTPGAMLRDAREASGQTHAAVGEALHLTVHYIKALENDDYSKLPGLIFVKGYIRSYGQYLKMDVDKLLRSYDSHLGVLGGSGTPSAGHASDAYDRRQHSRRRSDQSHGWALVAGFIVVVALGAGWWFYGRDQAVPVTSSTPAASTNTPVAANRSATDTSASGRSSNTATNTNSFTAANASPANNATIPATIPNAVQQTPGAAAPLIAGNSNVVAGGVNDASASSASAPENALPTADVTSAATAITPTGEVIQSNATNTAVLQTTVTADGVTIIPAADGSRQLSLFRAGNDELQLHFAGDSWVEIADGSDTRLYSDMLNSGDTLTILGTAPFQVMLGNARAVQLNFNDSAVDIAASIREDNTARVELANPANDAPIEGAGVAQ